MIFSTLRAEHAGICPSGRLAAYKQQYKILLFSSRGTINNNLNCAADTATTERARA